MKKVLDMGEKKCTGCSSCFNACPVNAIEMIPDLYGFERALFDENKCINCNICKDVCPVLHVSFSNEKKPKSYAAWANDAIRKSSSAGGAFSIFADYFLINNGVIYGAAFKNAVEVCHKSAQNSDELQSLRKSKYVQSHIGNSFSEIKKLLDAGTAVLFSGCPCQVAGLKAFLRKDYKNLFTLT